MRRLRGFTLFELIAVMVLVAVVMAMAAPALQGFTARSQASDAAATLLAAVNLARQRALQDGMPYRINVNTDDNTCNLTRRSGYAFTNITDTWGADIHIERTVTLMWQSPQREAHITFEPDGSAESRVLRVVGPRGDVFVIAVDPTTGRYAVTNGTEVTR